MLHRAGITFLFLLFLAVSAFGQEAEKGDAPTGPPKPLNDEWHRWLIGEWEGSSETNMGKTRDWMKVEWGPSKQFLVVHYKGKTTEINPKAIAEASEKMDMPKEEMEAMMKEDYYGLGVMTLNPRTGEPMGFWFDSYRDISKGSGTLEKGKSTMSWSSEAMGSMTRIMHKTGEDKMKVKMHGKDPSGMEWSGTSVMTRTK